MRACLLALSFIAFFTMSAMAADGPPTNFDVHGIITAANQGSAAAQYQLGLMLLSGQGVTKDRRKAGMWFDRSARQGNTDAEFQVAQMILSKEVPGDKTAAYFWLVLCSAKGDPNRVALRDKVEAELPHELVLVMKKKAASWKPQLEQIQVTAPKVRIDPLR